jgi:hypothetical protein
MKNYDKKIYEFNKTEKTEKKVLKYNGKEYPINCGYKRLKKLMKTFKNLDNSEDQIEETEQLIIELIGEKAFDNIVDDDFDYEDFAILFQTIMGAVQGVEPEDMEDFFRELKDQ